MAADIRPIPASYYWSGQGRFALGMRDATGRLDNMVFPGNATSVAIDIAVTKSDHKEAMTGGRGNDLTLYQAKTATIKIEVESLSVAVMTVGLWGANSSVTTGTVVAEPHKAKKGEAFPLRFPNVSSIVVKKAGTAINAASWDYDAKFGTIYIAAGASDVTDNDVLTVDYTYGASTTIEALTQAVAPERFVRFEGLNTASGDLRIIEAMRVVFDPLTGLEMINDDVAKGTLTGSIYPDLTVTTANKSQYFREFRVAG